MPAIIRVVDGRTIIKVGENSALAAASATLAEQFANEAGLSADAAALAAAAVGVYGTTAEGIGATTNGQSFYVTDGNDFALYENNAGVADLVISLPTATDVNARVPYTELASPVGLGLVGISAGRSLSDELKNFRTPPTLGGSPGTSDGSNQNTMMGGIGTFSSTPATARTSWDPINNLPDLVTNSLNLSGHVIVDNANSATILGGRPSYYSAVGNDQSDIGVNGYGSLTLTYGGDNWNSHLAGFCLSMHSDLIQGTGTDGVTQKGSHGFALGGTFHQIAGDYSGSVGGRLKQVFALETCAFGGTRIKIGTLGDVDAVRRSATLGGAILTMDNAEESVMLGGRENILEGFQSALIGGVNCKVNSDRAFMAGSLDSEISADGAAVIGGQYAKGDVVNAITRSTGRFSVLGDSQTHHIEIRRESVGTIVGLSVSGLGGDSLFTPEPNTTGIGTIEVVVQEAGVAVSNMAAYVLSFAFSNVDGTLVVKAENLVTVFEDDPSFNCRTTIAGSGTRVGVVLDVPNSNVYRATATGRIVVNRI